MASKAETRQLAGELLRLIPIGQALQSQHDVKMGEAYDEVYADLEARGFAVWDTSEEMADEITPHFIGLMAFNKMDLYGVSDSLYARIIKKVGDEGDKAIDSIRQLLATPYAATTDPTDY